MTFFEERLMMISARNNQLTTNSLDSLNLFYTEQTPHAVVMVRPHHFQSNLQTMQDNAFQGQLTDVSAQEVAALAYAEVTLAVEQLKSAGVTVHLFEDTENGKTPDSVFPNNWFSTHSDGKLIVYPMFCLNRRSEIRQDILTFIQHNYHASDVIDLSHYVKKDEFLEGTGSIVFNHASKISYACSSSRTSLFLLNVVSNSLGYKVHFFKANTQDGIAIYHTNVMMSIGEKFAMVGLNTISDKLQKQKLEQSLLDSGLEIIQLSHEQIHAFAGNTLELRGKNGPVLALSEVAMRSLHANQIAQLKQYVHLLPLKIPTIELAGGSVRCMLAGIHCQPK